MIVPTEVMFWMAFQTATSPLVDCSKVGLLDYVPPRAKSPDEDPSDEPDPTDPQTQEYTEETEETDATGNNFDFATEQSVS